MYNENFNQTNEGINFSRNYNSSTVSSTNSNFRAPHDPRQDSHFLHDNYSNPNFQASPFSNPDNTFRLPIEIQQYLKHNSIVNVRVREYDLSISNNSTISSIPSNNSISNTPFNNSMLTRNRANMNLHQKYEQEKLNDTRGSNQLLALTNSNNNQMEMSLFKMPPPRKIPKELMNEMKSNKNHSLYKSAQQPKQHQNTSQSSSSKLVEKNSKAKLTRENVSRSSSSSTSSKAPEKNLKEKPVQDQKKLEQKVKSSKKSQESISDYTLQKAKSESQERQSQKNLKPPASDSQINKASTSAQQSTSQVSFKKIPSQKTLKETTQNSSTLPKAAPPILLNVDPQKSSKISEKAAKVVPQISLTSQKTAPLKSSNVDPQKTSKAVSETSQKTLPVRKSRENLMKRQDKIKLTTQHPKHKHTESSKSSKSQQKAIIKPSLVDLTLTPSSSSSSDSSNGISEPKQICLKGDQKNTKTKNELKLNDTASLKSDPNNTKVIKELTMDDVSTAGSSLSTDSDDLFYLGKAHYEKMRFNHRVKKFTKRISKIRGDPIRVPSSDAIGKKNQSEIKPQSQKSKTKGVIKSIPKPHVSDSSSDGEAEFYALVAKSAAAQKKKEAEAAAQKKKEAETVAQELKEAEAQKKKKAALQSLIDTDSD